jgi:hypothetical protein
MHIVQSYPPGNPGWLVEGIADYARYKYGINNKAAGWQLPKYSSSQSYKDSYRVTARFLVWITQNYEKDIVVKLDKTMRGGIYNSFTWKKYTGKSVEELWSEYEKNPKINKEKMKKQL